MLALERERSGCRRVRGERSEMRQDLFYGTLLGARACFEPSNPTCHASRPITGTTASHTSPRRGHSRVPVQPIRHHGKPYNNQKGRRYQYCVSWSADIGSVTESAGPHSTQRNRRFRAETPITRVRRIRSLMVAALIGQPDPAGSVTDLLTYCDYLRPVAACRAAERRPVA